MGWFSCCIQDAAAPAQTTAKNSALIAAANGPVQCVAEPVARPAAPAPASPAKAAPPGSPARPATPKASPVKASPKASPSPGPRPAQRTDLLPENRDAEEFEGKGGASSVIHRNGPRRRASRIDAARSRRWLPRRASSDVSRRWLPRRASSDLSRRWLPRRASRTRLLGWHKELFRHDESRRHVLSELKGLTPEDLRSLERDELADLLEKFEADLSDAQRAEVADIIAGYSTEEESSEDEAADEPARPRLMTTDMKEAADKVLV